MATQHKPTSLLTQSPRTLLAAVRNVLPHLINQPAAEAEIMEKFDVLDLHLDRYEKTIEILQATTWFEGIHPDQPLELPKPEAAPVLCELGHLKNQLLTMLNNGHVTNDERSKMLAGINKLDSVEKVQNSLGKLGKAIADREAAANAELVRAHDEYDGGQKEALLQDAFPDETRQQPAKTPQQIRDAKQAEQYGGVADADQFDAAQGTPAKEKPARKPRTPKAAAEPEKPAVDITDPDALAPTGQEGKMIDENCGLGGTNLFANLDQKKTILKLALDPKITNNERSKIYLGINKISYADADRSITKMRGWIKDRPAPAVTTRPPVAPAGDPVHPASQADQAPAYDPDKLPWQQPV